MSTPTDGCGAPAKEPRQNAAAAKLQVPVQYDADGRQDTSGHAAQVRGTLVVVVETPGGKYRRRAYLTLASAERAVRRAEEKGYVASVVLARLEPVAGWSP